MEGRLLEIAGEGRTLKLYRGFLLVEQRGEELARIALDDLEAVIVGGYGSFLSQNILAELATRGVPVVLCNQKQSPIGILWGLDGHHQVGRISQQQAALKLPLKKRLWQQIVQAKIQNQAALLRAFNLNCAGVERLSKEVLVGDSMHCESRAAALYWPALFGVHFRRDREEPGINVLLNYGYTVLRASVSRAICAAGLLPVLSLQHHNRYNAMPLADDLMEPWRPLVDLAVYALAAAGRTALEGAEKKFLVEVLSWDMVGERGATPLRRAIQEQATSLAQTVLGDRERLLLAQLPNLEELYSVVEEACAN